MAVKNLYWGTLFLLFCGLLCQSQLSCASDPEKGKVIHFDINPETILTENLIGEEGGLEEIIFGTEDKKLVVLDFDSLKVRFSLSTEANVTHIGVADINNDEHNELIFSTADSLLCAYTCNGCVLFREDLKEQVPETRILDFTFLDVNRDDATDIILGTSHGIEARDAVEQRRLWWQPNVWSGGSVLHLTTADMDRFGEQEIVGHTEDTLFMLSYSGGILWTRKFPAHITALSIYSDPQSYPRQSIIVALDDRTLMKIDDNGWNISWGNGDDKRALDMIVSKIVPSRRDAASEKHDFFFLIPDSDEERTEVITISGDLVDFECGCVQDIICFNLDSKEVYPYSTEDYEEVIVSESDKRVGIYRHCEGELEEVPFEYLYENQLSEEDSEEVKFSAIIEEDENCFTLFRVLKKQGTWKIRRETLFEDVTKFFLCYKQAGEEYEEQNYGAAFLLYDMLLGTIYKEIADYYDLSSEIEYMKKECNTSMEEARRQVIKEINERNNNGSEKEKREDLFGAMIDFFEVYKSFNTLETYEDIMQSVSGDEKPEITQEEVEHKILKLLLPILDEAHRKYTRRAYKEAHHYFLGLYPIYKEYFPEERSDNEADKFPKAYEYLLEEYQYLREEYEYLLDEYPDQKSIIKVINSCVEQIKREAEEYFSEGEYRDALEQYTAIGEILGEETEISYTAEYDVEEINGKIDECDREIKKNYYIYFCIGLILLFLSGLIFVYREQIRKRFFQREKWTTEELYDRLDESEKLLNTGYAEPAANLAGKVLEKALKMYIRGDPQLYQKWNPRKDQKKDKRAPLGQIIPWLSKYDAQIDEIQTSKLDYWRRIRNRSSHDTEEEIHEFDVNDMIEGIRDFVVRFLEPRYQKI